MSMKSSGLLKICAMHMQASSIRRKPRTRRNWRRPYPPLRACQTAPHKKPYWADQSIRQAKRRRLRLRGLNRRALRINTMPNAPCGSPPARPARPQPFPTPHPMPSSRVWRQIRLKINSFRHRPPRFKNLFRPFRRPRPQRRNRLKVFPAPLRVLRYTARWPGKYNGIFPLMPANSVLVQRAFLRERGSLNRTAAICSPSCPRALCSHSSTIRLG